MEGIINSVRSLFGAYGFRAASIVLATVVVVNIVKKPIVKKAERLAADCGLDKSVLTKNVTLLPVAVAFVLELIVSLCERKFRFASVDYGSVVSSAVLYGALAVATYESVKKQLEAYSAKRNAKTECKAERIVGDATVEGALPTAEGVRQSETEGVSSDGNCEDVRFSENGDCDN